MSDLIQFLADTPLISRHPPVHIRSPAIAAPHATPMHSSSRAHAM